MMHSTLKFMLSALAAAVMVPASAQTGYVTEAPAGGFDFSTAKDIVVLYAPDEVITKMGDKIKSNQNLDPTNTNNQFFYWVTDWDKKDLTLVNVDREGATNSYGGSNMMTNMGGVGLVLNVTRNRSISMSVNTPQTLHNPYRFSKQFKTRAY